MTLVAACGPSTEDRLAAETLAATEPLVAAFAADLDAGRIEPARARMTQALQSVATPDKARLVVQSEVGVLGRMVGRDAPKVEKLETTESSKGPVVRAATISYTARCEKGSARLETRVERGAADGVWRVDAWTVTGPVFTWALQ